MCELLEKVERLEAQVARLEELLLAGRVTTEATPEWLTAKEAADMVGLKVPTIRAYCERRVVTFSTAGRRLLINRTSLETYIKENAKLSTRAKLEEYNNNNQWTRKSI